MLFGDNSGDDRFLGRSVFTVLGPNYAGIYAEKEGIRLTLLALTALLAALITLSITISIFVRARRSRLQTLFAILNANLGLCLIFVFLLSLNHPMVRMWGGRFFLLAALALPITALRFFSLFLADLEKTLSSMLNVSYPVSVMLGAVTLTPFYHTQLFRFLCNVFITSIFAFCFILIVMRFRSSPSSGERSRLRPVFFGGFATLILVVLDLISFHLDWPYVFLGSLCLAIYMYYMLQIVLSARALDMSEILGRGVVLGILAFFIAGLYWLMTVWTKTSKLGTFFPTVLVASIIILILYEPLKNEVEGRAAEYFFRQRRELRVLLEQLRRDLAHVIDLDKTSRLLLERLRRSKRVTHASFYLLRANANGYERVHSFGLGEPPVTLVDLGRHASFIQSLEEELAPVVKQDIEFRYTSTLLHWKVQGEGLFEEERLIDTLRSLDDIKADVSFPCISSNNKILGFINLKDERFEDAYSSEEQSFMMMVAAQVAITIENSRIFEKVKERGRLAALGEMAAGMAHEIRNPLGAIKGAAQLLNPDAFDESEAEFLSIILEEVDRLNSVVTQFLDYARPLRSGFALTDVNQVLERTLLLLEAEELMSAIKIEKSLQDNLPLLHADAEQLKQVFINLIRNGSEAMAGEGVIHISTELIEDLDSPVVEITVSDEGEGIDEKDLKNIFIPFYTTKSKGTGLGLSICQRIIENHDGTIEMQSELEQGTQFMIRLPVQRSNPSAIGG